MPLGTTDARERLLAVVGGEHAEHDGNARIERDALKTARTLPRDVLEVSGLAPDHGAEGHEPPVERPERGDAAVDRRRAVPRLLHAGDVDALVELYDPEAVFETLLLGTHQGNESIREIYAENGFAAKAIRLFRSQVGESNA